MKKADKQFVLSFGKCMYCGSTDKMTIDHIVPCHHEGTSNRDNLTSACRKCNSYKGTLSVTGFLDKIIHKRMSLYEEVLSCIFRLRHNRKNKNISKLSIWLEKKIIEYRGTFSYYTAIIHSITTQRYVLPNRKTLVA